jgi:hypothetical protein
VVVRSTRRLVFIHVYVDNLHNLVMRGLDCSVSVQAALKAFWLSGHKVGVVRFDNEERFARDGSVKKTFESVEEEEDPWDNNVLASD